MFEYVFTPNDPPAEINTEGFCKNFQEIKKEKISLTPERILYRSTYPNGFIFESEQYAGKIIIRTNWELKKANDGTFTVLQP